MLFKHYMNFIESIREPISVHGFKQINDQHSQTEFNSQVSKRLFFVQSILQKRLLCWKKKKITEQISQTVSIKIEVKQHIFLTAQWR